MSVSGSELQENNEKIVKFMKILKQQKDEIAFLIERQEQEKIKIQNEIERLTYKLSLLTKSLRQRTEAKMNYENTIKEINDKYGDLVDSSGKLLNTINEDVILLESFMDKKSGTAETNAPSFPDILETSSYHIEEKNTSGTNEDVQFVPVTHLNDSQYMEDDAFKISNLIVQEKDFDGENEQNSGLIETKDLNKKQPNMYKEKNNIPSKVELKDAAHQSKKSRASIDEVQTFREAYDRQHRSSRSPTVIIKKVQTQEPSLRSLIQKPQSKT